MAGLATSTGMSALAAAVLSWCSAGDVAICQADIYGGTLSLLRADLGRLGITSVPVDIYSCRAVEDALRAHMAPNEGPAAAGANGNGNGRAAAAAKERKKRAVVLLETVSNPLLRVPDVAAIAGLCGQYGALLVADNTFATPLRGRPLEQGADLVMHSVTKFLGGHSDLMAGAIVGGADAVARTREVSARMGFTAAPVDAWLAVRGIRTLKVRMERSWATAAELAARLRAHRSAVSTLAAPRCSIVCVEVQNGASGADAAVRAFRLVSLSPSLGGVTTSVSHPATSSAREMPPAEMAALGIRGGLLRISVGMEDVDDIWRDLQRGLEAAARAAPEGERKPR